VRQGDLGVRLYFSPLFLEMPVQSYMDSKLCCMRLKSYCLFQFVVCGNTVFQAYPRKCWMLTVSYTNIESIEAWLYIGLSHIYFALLHWFSVAPSRMFWLQGPTDFLTLSDPTSNLVRQYDFPVPLQCRKTSDMVFVTFFRPLSEPVRRFSSCSMDFSHLIAQVVLFLHVFLF
jgi:hypothetical protein